MNTEFKEDAAPVNPGAASKFDRQSYMRAWRDRNREKRRIAAREWRRSNPDRCRQNQKRYLDRHRDRKRLSWRINNFKTKYGLTLAQRDELIAAQGGLCAICGLPPGKSGLQIDHDHRTGKVRELLCICCNTGLGKFRDTPELLQKALDYLRKHSLSG